MPPPRGLIQHLDHQLHRSDLLPQRARLLLAVSGGADSVALLRLLHAINQSRHWQWTLLVAHIHHGIRGRSANLDAAFVKSLAKSLALPFLERRLKLGRSASEATARTARFRALAAMAKQKKCDAIVLAHHADDQAETVLLRLIRGAGLDGLAGMATSARLQNMTVLRPLLGIRRETLRQYLQSIDQDWHEDETNATDAYLRNRLRQTVLPPLQRIAPAAIESIGRAALLAGAAQQILDSLALELLQESTITQTKRRITLRRAILQQAAPILCGELLRQLVRTLGGSTESSDFERIGEALRMIRATAGGKSVQMGRGIVARAGAGIVTVEKPR
ncbi:MAG TPA: tRNA lysidine(34) synthetase TilS [Phycisphaerae bacterium]|nr:tRNA lysidine(34) synthetase TilS [Phycisphaerae bacterium]